ncbi:MAG: type II secretion system protein, partial [Bacilli bacterium]|nr:type II secretion system protein [Bacilli bacterium]
MNMNKKGFTLVELIGVIVILAILSLLAVRTYGNVMNNIAKKQLEEKILTIEKAAMSYGQDNKGLLTGSCVIDGETYSKCATVKVSDLISDNRIESDETDEN